MDLHRYQNLHLDIINTGQSKGASDVKEPFKNLPAGQAWKDPRAPGQASPFESCYRSRSSVLSGWILLCLSSSKPHTGSHDSRCLLILNNTPPLRPRLAEYSCIRGVRRTSRTTSPVREAINQLAQKPRIGNTGHVAIEEVIRGHELTSVEEKACMPLCQSQRNGTFF